MDRWQGKVAVVTGASSGIGAAIAKDLVESGMKVVGLARRLERMEQDAAKMNTSKGGHYYPRKCDVSKEEEILEAFAWVKKTFGGVDVLVNNAGIVRANMLVNPGNSNDLRSVIDVNVMALCYCTREAFNSMKERDVAGHIIHINSIGGHSIPSAGDAPPTANMYFGSKHCVTALTETLRQEMIYLKSRTKVTSISPGVVDTEIFDGSFPSKEIKEMFLANNPSLKSEDVSQAVLYALGTPEHVQVHELIIKPIGEKL
ncbi:farnesol dehydrogenase-like [Ctenocephalides felis]|uniref:farnesol dehydrogenase-like n=1 Tax=Ctenocephalides felis TaxID=7515 RepID=UPI000E6E4C89|nr:farnesol dehydrogenase-like [Ctenocephalides felis]